MLLRKWQEKAIIWLAVSSQTGPQHTCAWKDVLVEGRPEDCSRIRDALVWLADFSKSMADGVARDIRVIHTVPRVKSTILPIMRTCLVDSSTMLRASEKRFATRFVSAGSYIAKCRTTGEYRIRSF